MSMDIFEEAVLTYLSAPPGRFIRSQFSIAYQNGAGGSCPDFVVLDFPKTTVYGRTEQTNVKFHRLKESTVKTSK
jgi:hypothetical protein